MTGVAAVPAASAGVAALQVDVPAGLLRPVAEVIGLAVAGGATAGLAAAAYYWYARDRIPGGLAVLLSLGVVALHLNTTVALQHVVGGGDGVFELGRVLGNVAAFAAAGLAGPAGARAGTRLAVAALATSGTRELEGNVGELVQAVGRVIAVELPDEIGDMEAYDPVPPETKAELAGRTLVFPRRLTVEELHERLVARLKDDYGVGYVDVDLAADGTVEHLALGSRVAGLGPTLPPRTAAVAVRADPGFAASAGDLVQVWRPGDPPERVTTAELRGVAGDVATLAVDVGEAERFDDATRYRLVTLPATPRPEYEFASLLRSADETLGATEVAGDSPLVGRPVDDLGVTVVAVRPWEGGLEALPRRDRTLAAGDTAYAVARPEALRRFEAAAGADAADPAGAPATDDPARGR